MAPTTPPLSRQFNSLQTTKTTRDRAKPSRILVSSIGDATELTQRQSATFNFGAAQKSPTLPSPQPNGFIANEEIGAAAAQQFDTHSLSSHSDMRWPSKHPYQAPTTPKTNFYCSTLIPPPS